MPKQNKTKQNTLTHKNLKATIATASISNQEEERKYVRVYRQSRKNQEN
jgi:hypothetical protein